MSSLPYIDRVHQIGLVFVPTHAGEEGLRSPVVPRDEPARQTSLAGVDGSATRPHELVVEHRAKCAPALIEDRALAVDVSAGYFGHPGRLGQILRYERLWIGISEALVIIAFPLEPREQSVALKEVPVGTFQILQSVLQGVTWNIGKPRRFSAPPGKQLRHGNVVEVLFVPLAEFALKRQGFVEDEPVATD